MNGRLALERRIAVLVLVLAAVALIGLRVPERVASPRHAPALAPPRAEAAPASAAPAPLPAAVAPRGALAASAADGPVRAAYFYSYMPAAHLDSLWAHGFRRALVHTVADSLDARSRAEFRALSARADSLGVEFAPEWLFQSAPRLAARPAARRYTWGRGTLEPEAPCPLDSAYWQSAVFDRAEELLAAFPQVTRLVLDLELYRAGRHHYDAGACECGACVEEYTAAAPELRGRPAGELSGLLAWEEVRLRAMLAPMLARFARRHPGVRLEVFDLDFDSFVHRALGRALAAAGIGTTDYTERTYSLGAVMLPAARARLRRIGQESAPLVGGLWLKRWSPAALPSAMRAIDARSDGVFVFTTYSLWLDPAQLSGAYALQGAPRDYWAALERGSATP